MLAQQFQALDVFFAGSLKKNLNMQQINKLQNIVTKKKIQGDADSNEDIEMEVDSGNSIEQWLMNYIQFKKNVIDKWFMDHNEYQLNKMQIDGGIKRIQYKLNNNEMKFNNKQEWYLYKIYKAMKNPRLTKKQNKLNTINFIDQNTKNRDRINTNEFNNMMKQINLTRIKRLHADRKSQLQQISKRQFQQQQTPVIQKNKKITDIIDNQLFINALFDKTSDQKWTYLKTCIALVRSKGLLDFDQNENLQFDNPLKRTGGWFTLDYSATSTDPLLSILQNAFLVDQAHDYWSTTLHHNATINAETKKYLSDDPLNDLKSNIDSIITRTYGTQFDTIGNIVDIAAAIKSANIKIDNFVRFSDYRKQLIMPLITKHFENIQRMEYEDKLILYSYLYLMSTGFSDKVQIYTDRTLSNYPVFSDKYMNKKCYIDGSGVLESKIGSAMILKNSGDAIETLQTKYDPGSYEAKYAQPQSSIEHTTQLRALTDALNLIWSKYIHDGTLELIREMYVLERKNNVGTYYNNFIIQQQTSGDRYSLVQFSAKTCDHKSIPPCTCYDAAKKLVRINKTFKVEKGAAQLFKHGIPIQYQIQLSTYIGIPNNFFTDQYQKNCNKYIQFWNDYPRLKGILDKYTIKLNSYVEIDDWMTMVSECYEEILNAYTTKTDRTFILQNQTHIDMYLMEAYNTRLFQYIYRRFLKKYPLDGKKAIIEATQVFLLLKCLGDFGQSLYVTYDINLCCISKDRSFQAIQMLLASKTDNNSGVFLGPSSKTTSDISGIHHNIANYKIPCCPDCKKIQQILTKKQDKISKATQMIDNIHIYEINPLISVVHNSTDKYFTLKCNCTYDHRGDGVRKDLFAVMVTLIEISQSFQQKYIAIDHSHNLTDMNIVNQQLQEFVLFKASAISNYDKQKQDFTNTVNATSKTSKKKKCNKFINYINIQSKAQCLYILAKLHQNEVDLTVLDDEQLANMSLLKFQIPQIP